MFLNRQLSDSTTQIKSLDGLRGLAVLIVLASHTSNVGLHFIPGLDFRGIGKSGVYLFFVLSAFLLTRNILVSRKPFATLSGLLNYAFRRFVRIFPVLIAFMAFAWSVNHFGLREFGLSPAFDQNQVLQHLTLQAGEGVLWSIPVEFKFYILLPFLAFLFYWTHKRHWTFGGVLLISLIVGHQSIWPQDETIPNTIATTPYLPIFLVGSYLGAVIAANKAPSHKFTMAFTLAGISGLTIIICLMPSVWQFIKQTETPSSFAHTQFILIAFAWMLVLIACFYGAPIFRKIMENPIMSFLGMISFSLYIWHTTVIYLVQHYIQINNSTINAWIILGGSVLLSTLSYILFEWTTSKIRLPKF